MTSQWVSKPVREVEVGQRVPTAAGEELTVTRIEQRFLGRDDMLALIEDTPRRWYKRPVPIDSAIEISG